MTKQLRKQFILVNMLLVGTVLLVVFAVLGVSTYRRQVQDSQRVLERYFMEKGNTPSPKLDFGAHRDWKDFPMRFSFCAVLDSDGGLVSYQSENLTLSRQTVEQAVQAERAGADYLGVGAVFSTSTKKDAADASKETLKAICEAVNIPVIAIGGIGADNILSLQGSGICGIAVVSAIFAAKDIEAATKVLKDRTEKMLK